MASVRLTVFEHVLEHRRADTGSPSASVQPLKMLQNARIKSGQVMIGSLS